MFAHLESKRAAAWVAWYLEIVAGYSEVGRSIDRVNQFLSDRPQANIAELAELFERSKRMHRELQRFDADSTDITADLSTRDVQPDGASILRPNIFDDLAASESLLHKILNMEFVIGRNMVDLREQLGSANFEREFKSKCGAVPWRHAESFMNNALASTFAAKFDAFGE